MEKSTLVIGDTHGHYDRLAALLFQEQVLVDGPHGLIRNPELDARVIHIGDLIHAGPDSQANDREILHRVLRDRWVDEVLWGNHDRTAFGDQNHAFGGFRLPFPETLDMLKELDRQGRVMFAAAAHGFLLTHAGLAKAFASQVADSAQDAANGLNTLRMASNRFIPVIDAVSPKRQGRYPAGGILWRDMSEPASDRHNQIFGHTAQTVSGVTVRGEEASGVCWYNIDIGGKSQRQLAGIWLPDETVVRVDLDSGSFADLADESRVLRELVSSAPR